MNEICPGTLYLVPTPIGNLEDMTERAVHVLQKADVIAAEDTRHTRILTERFGAPGKLVPYHEHNKEEAGPRIMAMLKAGKSVAQVSDAGMPVISDPGADLVQLALEENIPVVPLPGPNAALTALIASGLDARQFAFIGFLPKTGGKRKKLTDSICSLPMTLIFYEAPHRIKETLSFLRKELGNRRAVAARELTKKFETFSRGTLESLLEQMKEEAPRGEYVLLVEGGGEDPAPPGITENDWKSRAAGLADEGMTPREISRKIAGETHLSRRDIYQFLIKNKK